MQRIGFLDGWRGLAILGVLFGHFVSNTGINLGRFGVELFFVLSGRLMAEILFVRNTPLIEFFPRRIARVYPALLIFATIIFILSRFLPSLDVTIPDYLSAITFTTNYAQFWFPRNEILDHIWSLCIEEHMYLLLGLLAAIHRVRPLPMVGVTASIAALMMANGVIESLLGWDYYAVYWRTDVRGASIMVAVSLYLALRDGTPQWLLWSWLPLLLAGIGFTLNFSAVPDPIKYTVGSSCVAGSLILLAHAPKWVLNLFENPVLTQLGLWSYSLYLWQQPFYKLAFGHSLPIRLCILFAAFGVALLSFYFVEQPARRYLNRVWSPVHNS